jgi:hypothetical protein
MLPWKTKGQKGPKSTCDYHYNKWQYNRAKEFKPKTGNGHCTNVPLHCPFCKRSLSRHLKTVWKYNFVEHLSRWHSLDDGSLPKDSPLETWINSFILKAEEAAMGIPVKNTLRHRSGNDVPRSNDIQAMQDQLEEGSGSTEAEQSAKRGRLDTMSSRADPDPKRSKRK